MRFLSLLFLFSAAFAGQFQLISSPGYPIQVAPMGNSPTSDSVILKIVFPDDNELITNRSIRGQIRLESYSIGSMTRLPNFLKNLKVNPRGQTIHVFVDDLPYFELDVHNEYSPDENLQLYRRILNFRVPYKLKSGQHLIQAFPVLSYYESVKTGSPYSANLFYYRSKSNELKIDLSKPYLTYNEPQGQYKSGKGVPILVDFYVRNARLAPEAYKVILSIDGHVVAKLTKWQPYLIYNLPQGEHTIKMELIDGSDARVKNGFNPISRQIIVK